MEKTFGKDVIVFKNTINMKERQKISSIVRKRQEDKDEMQMTFDIFPVWVVSINGQTDLTDDQKKEWIENLTDLQMFKEVAEVLGELQTTAGGLDEKKKISSPMNSTK